MKAFVAVVAALCSSAKAQYPILPYTGLPIAAPAAVAPAPATVAYTSAAPVVAPVVPAPVVAAAPTVSSQFQSQDEFGNTAHGYASFNSAKHEQGNTYLGVTGSYSYVDANGVLQTTNYIADGLGFRVQATNLPVAPAAPEVAALEAPVFNLEAPVFDLVGPAPVEDTPEVAAAKAEFQAKFDEVASRSKRSTPAATAPLAPLAVAPFAPYTYGAAPFYAGAYAHGAYAPAAYAPYNLAPAAPVAYATAPAPAAAVVPSLPAAREAILTKVQLNPGHCRIQSGLRIQQQPHCQQSFQGIIIFDQVRRT